MKKSRGGFTLVEAVVVIAVVALLSAIIVPLAAKQIDEAKKARARNDCLVIAAAMQMFLRDVGTWPSSACCVGGRLVTNGVYVLVSGTAVQTIATGIGTDYGYTANGYDDWYDAGTDQDLSCICIDTFDNHLNANQPMGQTGQVYPTSGEFRWKGPYLPPIGKDPWGHYYVANTWALGNGGQCVVLSAGPNGYFDTPPSPAVTVTGPSGDDIWATVHLKN